ncbi:Histone chaperone [Cercospora beticola]|uniref:Histone chaperone n=1 Tax=Cercospora beticola TaxID=122368 RepID=A0A2G5HJ97_CERBT|nr:Histone chaperone [Cercospora beticola]PIA92610.1 Histone chaperone [Cercospora beticola]WPB02583.1 hypothetical protein RHO25_007219 [Cercospora beticola]
MAADWTTEVQAAFQGDPDLAARIVAVGTQYQGELPALFADIARYVRGGTATLSVQPGNTKKRKLDDASQPTQSSTNGTTAGAGIANPTTTFECKNVSFQVPARKKLKLQLVAEQSDSRRREVRLLNAQTNDIEYTIPNGQIDQIFCLPVPEKQQRQSSFVIIPQAGAVAADGTSCEQIVFTMNETKPDDAASASRAKTEQDNYITVTEPELNDLLHAYGKQVVRPDENEFASSIPQSHRKGEKAYHVKAHRGTKEGYLFFLPNGILFGFKKPLSFFPFSSVESISYTSVLQRTFNLVITATEGGSTEGKDVEFSMIDQADFAGIDEYVKRHGLNDASMAAERRAKAYNVNKEKKDANGDGGEQAPAGGVGEDGLTELQRAEQQLQDQEDEEEEDYVESGGESDGEGESSEEDGEGYAEGEGEYDEEEEVEE